MICKGLNLPHLTAGIRMVLTLCQATKSKSTFSSVASLKLSFLCIKISFIMNTSKIVKSNRRTLCTDGVLRLTLLAERSSLLTKSILDQWIILLVASKLPKFTIAIASQWGCTCNSTWTLCSPK